MTEDDVTALARRVGRACLRRKLEVSVAESCTGGGLAAAITRISGSAKWFDRGFVTYSNTAKRDLLGVSQRTLARHGAVSEEVAREMASGVRTRFTVDVGVSVTGIAGPGGGTPDKPVGTFCVAVDVRGVVHSVRTSSVGDRHEVRQRSAQAALNLVRKALAE